MSVQSSENNKRIAKNTLVLYLRMLITVGISFYSTRLILANLGVEDYGVYNVIGGFVTMFYMVTSTLTQAVSRFLTFQLGIGDMEKLKTTFATSLNILVGLSLLVVLLAETVGLWFVNDQLNIAEGRMAAANWIYQFTVLSFIVEIVSVPYSASVITHERMGAFAFVTIVKVFLTFAIALALSISPFDKLIFYGFLMLLVSIAIQLLYWGYCRRHFEECKWDRHIDRTLFKEMFGFAGWNFLTTVSTMLSGQGVNIMLNMYFGTVVNAARGIGNQINGTATAFSRNFMTAINPQITKSYAAGDHDYTASLIYRGAKFSYLLLLIIALPCILEMDYILNIWLTDVPQYAAIFAQLTLIVSLMEVLLSTQFTLNQASGDIRNYQIVLCTLQFLTVVFSYLVLRFTNSPVWTIAVTNIMYVVMFVPRITINRKIVGIGFCDFFRNVMVGILLVTIVSTLLCLAVQQIISEGFFRLVIVTAVSTVAISASSYIFALSGNERAKINGLARKIWGGWIR